MADQPRSRQSDPKSEITTLVDLTAAMQYLFQAKSRETAPTNSLHELHMVR
jgi:hypothetical protein